MIARLCQGIRRAAGVAAALMLWGAAVAVPASEPKPQSGAPELTAADLAAFFDGYLPIEMERADIAGAVVTVVKDGQVLYARGFGHADRERKVPVAPETTLFRIGSVSKLLTATAVMQLVEQGKLDLDADVRRYLDFPLPPAYGQPVTLRHLLTHTAGFEERLQGMWALPGESLALRDYLSRHVPARIFPPGTTPAYSNFGATLAGYIVERQSGEVFNGYVQRHILEPLGMRHTSFEQPLPPALAAQLSQGYDQGSDPARPFETVRDAPAGSASASAADMARFMLAHLNGGSLYGQSILQPATLASMHAPQHRHHPQAPALALGFYEDGGFGHRVIGHGGDLQWFHSGLYLLPEQRVGLFFSQNSAGKRVLRDALFRRFVARYFPPAPAEATAGAATDGVPDVTGYYMTTRRAEHSPVRLVSLFSQIRIDRNADGTLVASVMKSLNDKPVRLQPAGGNVWQGADDPNRRLFFQRNPEGRWEVTGRVPFEIGQRVAWYENAGLLSLLLGGSLLIAVLTLAAWPVAAAVRRHYGRQSAVLPRQQTARKAIRWAALGIVLPWAALGLALLIGGNDYSFLMGPRFMLALRIVQVGAWLGILGALAAVWATRIAWRTPGIWWWGRVHPLLIVAAGAASTAILWQGQLLFWAGNF